jgi:hypothetical protein
MIKRTALAAAPTPGGGEVTRYIGRHGTGRVAKRTTSPRTLLILSR